MQIRFRLHDWHTIRRDILWTDKVRDLKEILGVPKDTEINFLYKGYFLDPEPDSENLDAGLQGIIFRNDPDIESGIPPNPWQDTSFILVSNGKIPQEYERAKWNSNGIYPRDVEPINDPLMDLVGPDRPPFTKDDYDKYRSLYMERLSDYYINAHGAVEYNFIFVPENITLILNTEFGSSVGTANSLNKSIRTHRRMMDDRTSTVSGLKITRTYNPGSIVPEHKLHLRGFWDPMGSGLIPKEVFDIVEDNPTLNYLEDYNKKYPDRCWDAKAAAESALTGMTKGGTEMKAETKAIYKRLFLKEQARGSYFGRCGAPEASNQINGNEPPKYLNGSEGSEHELREGDFWFNIYPNLRNEEVQLSKMLYWLSEFVGDKSVTVNCSFCRPVNYSLMEREMKNCLLYDSQIFKDTFLEDFQEKGGVKELTRERSFSSLDITKQAILSELERYETLNITLPTLSDYDIEKLISLAATRQDIYDYTDLLNCSYKDRARWCDKPPLKETLTEIRGLLHITGEKGNYKLNNSQDHKINELVNPTDKDEDEHIILKKLKMIENYYMEFLAKKASCDINILKLHSAYTYVSKINNLKSSASLRWSDLCQILLFMKLMRENQGTSLSSTGPLGAVALPEQTTEQEALEPVQQGTESAIGGGRRRGRRTKRKGSKKRKIRRSRRTRRRR